MKSEKTFQLEKLIEDHNVAIYGDTCIDIERDNFTVHEMYLYSPDFYNRRIVDVARLVPYNENERADCICKKAHQKFKELKSCNQKPTEDGKFPFLCDNGDCRNQKLKFYGDASFLGLCFEVKVSKQDFHSKSGHNFVGDYNYYVMPREVFDAVENEIPTHVGVLCPDKKWKELCEVKSPVRTPMSQEDLKWFIYSFMFKFYKKMAGGNELNHNKTDHDHVEKY